jgi:thiol-disulfide isomerase/thioredoxin
VLRVTLPAFLVVLFSLQAVAQDSSDPVAQALAQGDLYLSRRKYELAFDAYPAANVATVEETRRVIANPIRARMPFAPKFSFTTHDNQKISNASVRGRVVLLDFWGTWCPPCRDSVPILRDLNKKYAGKAFQLVGVSSDDDEEVCTYEKTWGVVSCSSQPEPASM